MKQRLLICSLAALLAAISCTERQELPAQSPVRLRVEGVGAYTRAATNYTAADYFSLEGFGKATVISKSTASYVYAEGELTGATEQDVLYFPVDGSALPSVKVRWPDDAVRQSQGSAVVKDQSSRAAFLTADWLSAELRSVSPAQSIPFTLEHERVKVTFTLIGAMAGQKILSLSIAGYKAYCDAAPTEKSAQLILLPGSTDIQAEQIGTLSVEGKSGLSNIVIKSVPTLVAGENHTIEINL